MASRNLKWNLVREMGKSYIWWSGGGGGGW